MRRLKAVEIEFGLLLFGVLFLMLKAFEAVIETIK